jgi:hypothetical protein
MHTIEPLIPEPSSFDVDNAIENLKRYKPWDIDGILAELMEAGGKTLRSEIHRPIHSIWNKEELPQQW